MPPPPPETPPVDDPLEATDSGTRGVAVEDPVRVIVVEHETEGAGGAEVVVMPLMVNNADDGNHDTGRGAKPIDAGVVLTLKYPGTFHRIEGEHEVIEGVIGGRRLGEAEGSFPDDSPEGGLDDHNRGEDDPVPNSSQDTLNIRPQV